MPRYYIDSEIQDTRTAINLISIGITCEDGRELYGQSVEIDLRAGNDWVWENVYPHLEVCPYKPSELDRVFCCKHRMGQCTVIPEGESYNRCPWRTREQLKQDILAFMDVEKYGKPELISWMRDYEYGAFCRSLGDLIEIPQGSLYDLQSLLDEQGITNDMLPPQEIILHHSREDAKYIKHIWQMLQKEKVYG